MSLTWSTTAVFEHIPAYDPTDTPYQAARRAEEESNEESNARLRTFWAVVFAQDQASRSLQDLYHYRVRVVWRVIRELGLTIGRLKADDPIRYLTPTLDKTTALPALHIDFSKGFFSTSLHEAIRFRYRGPHGLPLTTPPQLPPFETTTKPNKRFRECVDFAIRALKINRTSPLIDPNQCTLGTIGLDDTPATFHKAWPKFEHIVACEQFHVQETLEHYVTSGEIPTKQYLIDNYGFRPHEIRGLMALANREAVQRAELDIDVQRAHAVLRLQDIMHRAREACSLQNEIRAAKELHLVVGLGKVAPEDSMRLFAEAVTDLALERHRPPNELHMNHVTLVDAQSRVLQLPPPPPPPPETPTP